MVRYCLVLVAACVPHSLSTSSTTPSSSSSSPSSSSSSTSSDGASDASNNSFGVSAPPLVAEPTPAAHKDADGNLVPPGPPISDDARDCGAAHNHCLRGNAWFSTGMSAPNDVSSPAAAVFQLDGKWYAYNGDEAGSTIYRTKPATADEIQKARIVWVLTARDASSDVKSTLPKSEHDALFTRRWSMVTGVESVDAKEGTFVANGSKYKIDAARVAVEAKSAD